MSLTHVEHVEAVALIRNLAERLLHDFPGNPECEAALAWCDDHHPPTEAYLDAMRQVAQEAQDA